MREKEDFQGSEMTTEDCLDEFSDSDASGDGFDGSSEVKTETKNMPGEGQCDSTKQIEKLQSDYQALNDKYLRCLAEYDNFRKRTTREKDNIFSDAVVFAVKNFLDVLDNFERALQCETQDVEFKKGFEMIFNQFLEALKKLGVEEIQTDSQTFDPAFHNAVMHIEDGNYGENQIVETLQKGYKLGDNIIRYAMVKVAN